MSQLIAIDTWEEILSRYTHPNRHNEVMELFGQANGSVILAGGYVAKLANNTPLEDSDIDFFAVNKPYKKPPPNAYEYNLGLLESLTSLHTFNDSLPNAATKFQAFLMASCQKRSISSMAQTFEINGLKVQLVRKIHRTMQDVVDRFDFTVCQYAANAEYVFATPEAIHDYPASRLVINPTRTDLLRPTRVKKYIQKGFIPSCSTTVRVLLMLADGRTDHWMRTHLHNVGEIY